MTGSTPPPPPPAAPPPGSPTPEDVTFGRACLAFGLVTRDQLLGCVADQQRLAGQGRALTLPQVLIARQFITADQYRRVVEEIRRRLQAPLAAGGGGAVGPGGLPVPPEITASGRYYADELHQKLAEQARAMGNQPGPLQFDDRPPSADELRHAARTWDDASSVVEASYEVVAGPTALPTGTTVITPHVISPQAVMERRDGGIRKLLGVPEDAPEFDFGPYRILGEIASGGMGIIYRARAADTQQIYALKALINVEQASDKQLKRFVAEAQAAMRLDHPGIVKIHDLGVFENIPFFTMDLVEGKDLHHHLRQRTFTIDALLEIFVQVCQAVHYAHEHGVIHRDLKPANVIVRSRDRFPVLTDFGLAKNLDSTFKLTAEGAMVGTPLFLSPEQVSGKADQVDRRCDVYGLGVTLYQMLTDRLPFVGRNPYEVYKKVLEEDPTPPTQVNPGIPPELEKVCLMCLAKDREERYPTAVALAEDLTRFLRKEAVQARLPTPTVKKTTPASARRIEPGIGSTSNEPERAAAPPFADEAEPSTLTLFLIGVMLVLIVLGLVYIAYLLLIR